MSTNIFEKAVYSLHKNKMIYLGTRLFTYIGKSKPGTYLAQSGRFLFQGRLEIRLIQDNSAC